MIREGAMSRRMPVANRNDGIFVAVKNSNGGIDGRNDLIAARNRERSARTEIHLHITDQQYGMFVGLRDFGGNRSCHWGHALSDRISAVTRQL